MVGRRRKRTKTSANPGGFKKAKLEDGVGDNKSVGDFRSCNDAVETIQEQETRHLLSVFPEEIWLSIFDEISDPNMQEILSTSSILFWKLLLPQSVRFLFPKVWRILGLKYAKEVNSIWTYKIFKEADRGIQLESENSANNENDDDLTEMGQAIAVFPFQTVLRLRLVCQTWSRVIDEFYGNHPDLFKIRDDLDLWEKTCWKKTGIQCGPWAKDRFYHQRLGDFQKFRTHFKGTHGGGGRKGITARNPFVARSVSFESRSTKMPKIRDPFNHQEISSAPRFWTKISNFLRIYGQHIWRCVLVVRDHFPTRAAYYLKLREWLEMMPNLKVLEINYSRVKPKEGAVWFGYYDFGSEEPLVASFKELAELKMAISTNPLPRIQTLECIKTSDLPSPIFNELVRQNCHVSMLEARQDFVTENDYDIYSIPMPNLKQLSLKINTAEEFCILKSPAVTWSLEKFYLNMKDCPFVEWPIIWSMLQRKWKDTMENLVVYLPKAQRTETEKRIVKGSSTLRLDLPKVQRFKLTMPNYSSLNFILGMRASLEILDVDLEYDNEDLEELRRQGHLTTRMEKKQIIRLHHEEQSYMRDNNIWTLCPKLKKVHGGDYFLETRSRWMARHRKQSHPDVTEMG